MARWIIEPYWVIIDVAVPVMRLRIRGVRYDGIGAGKTESGRLHMAQLPL